MYNESRSASWLTEVVLHVNVMVKLYELPYGLHMAPIGCTVQWRELIRVPHINLQIKKYAMSIT